MAEMDEGGVGHVSRVEATQFEDGSPERVDAPVIERLSNDPDPRSRSIPATQRNEFHSAVLKLDWPQTAMSSA